MTPEQQRIALAEWAGWKRPNHPDVMKLKKGWATPELWWMCPKGVLRFKHDIPDYLNDLNAVHELEKKLDQSQCHTYTEHLASSPQDGTWAGCCMWHISAAQRCEALLKTLNLWTP